MKHLIAISFLFLAGCATYSRDGASQSDFYSDRQYCTLYATATNDNPTWSHSITKQIRIKQCLKERGWVSQ